ncbi:hypothetical protein J4434_05165 [Candidatus Woesearchaeota archaeon]|nr:hypothetical protein [Candidatus Woesearchaeota archaeon]
MNILIKEFIDSIDEEELYKLQYDLSKGSIALKKTVEEKIKEIENRKRKHCAVCGEELVEKEGVYTLIFPHENLTKKASFCATDCMEFFLGKLKSANSIIKANETEKNKNEMNNSEMKNEAISEENINKLNR